MGKQSTASQNAHIFPLRLKYLSQLGMANIESFIVCVTFLYKFFVFLDVGGYRIGLEGCRISKLKLEILSLRQKSESREGLVESLDNFLVGVAAF